MHELSSEKSHSTAHSTHVVLTGQLTRCVHVHVTAYVYAYVFLCACVKTSLKIKFFGCPGPSCGK